MENKYINVYWIDMEAVVNIDWNEVKGTKTIVLQ